MGDKGTEERPENTDAGRTKSARGFGGKDCEGRTGEG